MVNVDTQLTRPTFYSHRIRALPRLVTTTTKVVTACLQVDVTIVPGGCFGSFLSFDLLLYYSLDEGCVAIEMYSYG